MRRIKPRKTYYSGNSVFEIYDYMLVVYVCDDTDKTETYPLTKEQSDWMVALADKFKPVQLVKVFSNGVQVEDDV